ncbi:hypothetical protein [Salipiger mucosus]|uniref:Uncharacterized protein n=1 Tax=Salipiger mucosus DSM 16094 TaxID=1123237 RepID=S9QTU7_9RHOB|nr:hypothetical protein [Salipiger mucosus]EPX84796.1 hypothetical protein Salmuc_01369 [Salipiger mucosus DSM 16094]
MRQKEREKLCGLVAEWEFAAGSTSEAIGRNSCAEDLRLAFDLDATDELGWARFFKVIEATQPKGFPAYDDEEHEAWSDALEVLWDEVGYDGVVDLVEDGALIERLRPAADHFQDIIQAQAGAAL